MEQPEITQLEAVEHMLAYATEGRECYCDDEECSPETPKCYDMHAIAALDGLRRTLEPAHNSLQLSRLANDAERIFAEQWERTNVRRPGINHGHTTVEWVLCPDGQRLPSRVTQRDATVAASVIQWLGTSCGYGFMLQCERMIKEADAMRADWSGLVNWNHDPTPAEQAAAELLVGSLKSKLNSKQQMDLERSIAAALRKAKKDAVKNALEAALVGGAA